MTATAHAFSFPALTGGTIDLKAFSGRAVLVVNVASACGFTPQYKDLQALWTAREAQGLTVLGVPSNDFGAQEPGSEAEIGAFCERNFGVSFPLTAKQRVIGPDAHPFYRWITDTLGEDQAPRWNFHKYLLAKDGSIFGAFPSRVAPLSPDLTNAIDAALA